MNRRGADGYDEACRIEVPALPLVRVRIEDLEKCRSGLVPVLKGLDILPAEVRAVRG